MSAAGLSLLKRAQALQESRYQKSGAAQATGLSSEAALDFRATLLLVATSKNMHQNVQHQPDKFQSHDF